MIKSGKSTLHHLAITEQSVMVAKAASASAPSVLVDIKTFDLNDDGLDAALQEYLGHKKGQFSRAYCSVLPVSRFIRRVTLESANKAKDTAHLMELLSGTCKVNPSENEVAMLQSSGAQIDQERPNTKEIMFAGAKTDEISAIQTKLLGWGVFPLRLEIGTLPLLASIQKVAKSEGRKSPTLVLEVGENQSYIYIVGEHGVDMTRNISFGISAMLPHIKAELGLADEAVARKILLANTFDFAEMAPVLLRRLVKEIQASIGFYEVQTGYTIGQMYLANLSARFQWVGNHLSRSMGLDIMVVAFDRWMSAIGVEADAGLDLSNADPVVWNLISLSGNYE